MSRLCHWICVHFQIFFNACTVPLQVGLLMPKLKSLEVIGTNNDWEWLEHISVLELTVNDDKALFHLPKQLHSFHLTKGNSNLNENEISVCSTVTTLILTGFYHEESLHLFNKILVCFPQIQELKLQNWAVTIPSTMVAALPKTLRKIAFLELQWELWHDWIYWNLTESPTCCCFVGGEQWLKLFWELQNKNYYWLFCKLSHQMSTVPSTSCLRKSWQVCTSAAFSVSKQHNTQSPGVQKKII